MSIAADNTPKNHASLEALVVSQRYEIEHLKLVVAKLQRQQFGRRAEPHPESPDQINLGLACSSEAPKPLPIAPNRRSKRRQPTRKPLPEHLPRELHVHDMDTTDCPDCGGALRCIGEDVSEVLEFIPASFRVIRHVRPKRTCGCCKTVVQVAAPERPIARGLAGPGLLAHVLVSKYCDHLPLYRQSQIYAREGVDLPRSTLAGWVGESSRLLSPLVDALRRHTLSGSTVHADDTTVPVLSPGRGRTKTGRLWTYVRDERPAGGCTPPSVWFAYSPDRKGIRTQSHLASFHGTVHVDGYAGFNRLFEHELRHEAGCWAHVRRKFYDIHQAQGSPLAATALAYIQALYRIEDGIRGKPPDERLRVRQARAGPVLDAFSQWLELTLSRVSQKSGLAGAIRYALGRWPAMVRYCDDGHVEIDNNAAERALRCVALGRKNYLFAGSDKGGESAAAIYSLIGTAKLNGVEPQAYLSYVLENIGSHPVNRVDELLPWHLSLHLEKQRTEPNPPQARAA